MISNRESKTPAIGARPAVRHAGHGQFFERHGDARRLGGKHAGTLSGAMSMWGNLGGGLAPLVIGHIVYWSHGNWNLALYVSAAIYSLGVICWLLLDPVTPLEPSGAVGSS